EPSFTPDNKRIIFSSDYQDPRSRQFDLYITKLDGGTPEKVTNDPSPDCFPMFSPNGRYLAFTSGRGAPPPDAQNVFIAEWNEQEGQVPTWVAALSPPPPKSNYAAHAPAAPAARTSIRWRRRSRRAGTSRPRPRSMTLSALVCSQHSRRASSPAASSS